MILELESIQVKNINSTHKGYIKVICKGGKQEYILLHERAKESLALYVSSKKNNECFWESKYGPVTKTATLRSWVSRMCKILKEIDSSAPYFTPHTFRHSVIENLANGSHYLCEKIGRPLTIEEIQMIVHHKSTDMTKYYMKPKDNELIFGLFGIKIA